MSQHSSRIIILDFGGQYAHLIAKRIRRLGIFSVIKHPDSPVEEVSDACGIILSGGPSSVYDPDAPPYNPEIFYLGIPLLGLCYGHQLLTLELGGRVERTAMREFGRAEMEVLISEGLFEGLTSHEEVWMSHGDTVTAIPEGFKVLGRTSSCAFAACGDPERHIYGLQFHPEVTDTPKGDIILENFICICACEKTWSMESFLKEKTAEIRHEVGDRKVFLLVSGGVDSTVTFTLLNKALGQDRVQGLHIDNGFMRKNESSMVMDALDSLGFHNLMIVDRSETFLQKTKGVHDPQIKRRIIGDTFIDVWAETMKELDLSSDEWMLGQGTLYPDIIESGGSKHAAVIKTHHNRVPVINEMIKKGQVIEPLNDLYKDEVREVGELLGLPEEIVWRHPFPGPGLAVRVLSSDRELRSSDLIETAEKIRAVVGDLGYMGYVLPVRSVGVQGDSRTYAHPVVIEGLWDYDRFEALSTMLTNSIREINRVLAVAGGPPLTETVLTQCGLEKERLELLREADDRVTKILLEKNIYKNIFQMPVVVIPVSSDGQRESIVLRPLTSTDVMTARFARIPYETVEQMAKEILDIGGIEWVFYDLTHKPPGTFEWE